MEEVIPDEIKEHINTLFDAYDKLKELYHDSDKARAFLFEPNSCFFETSPLHWIIVGRGDAVLDFIEERCE